MSKEIEDLLKRVAELEKLVKKDSLKAFGRSYSSIGSSNSDFVIKTRGLVKIQWANKFIDLIKDGKINVDSKFIYSVNTKDDIGIKLGLYVTLDGSIYLKANGDPIPLVGEVGTTYVSFMELLETTPDLKYMAMKNIGFIYDSIDLVDESAIRNGIIYISNELKLYMISDGVISEFTVNIPNPYNNLFVIEKNNDLTGSFVIRGTGIENSIAFNSFYIYSEENSNYIDSSNPVIVRLNGYTIVTFDELTTLFNNKVIANTFLSIGASSNSGFRLYLQNGSSTLEVDNIVERNKLNTVKEYVYPEFYSKDNNIITSFNNVLDEESGSGYEIVLKYENTYKVDDYLCTYVEGIVTETISDEETGETREVKKTKLIKVIVKVVLIDTESTNAIYVQLLSEEELDALEEFPDLSGHIIFLLSSDNLTNLLRYSLLNLDLLQYTLYNEESNINSIKTRIGNISDLGLTMNDNSNLVNLKGFGLYTSLVAVDSAAYTSNYLLSDTDNSSKLASTEWINRLFPKGTIIMFNGLASEIPNGWAICDGNNGTPNLIGNFIKASDTAGLVGGNNEITLLILNLPSHTHNILTLNIWTDTSGSHRHSINYTNGDLGDITNNRNNIIGESTTYTDYAGEHNHNIDLTGIELETVGEGAPINIQPLYYTLIYIMKIF